MYAKARKLKLKGTEKEMKTYWGVWKGEEGERQEERSTEPGHGRRKVELCVGRARKEGEI